MKAKHFNTACAARPVAGARLRANATRSKSLRRVRIASVCYDSFAREGDPTIVLARDLTSARGFTLIEVIVAIVIAAVCFSALAGVFSGGMRTASTAAELARASTLAQSLIATAGIEKPLADGVENGTSADGLVWTLTVADESTEGEDAPIKPPLALKRVSARVVVPNDAQPERARVFELSTLRATPRPVLQP